MPAVLAGAALAAAGELPTGVACAAVTAGMVISDWCLYAAGAIAGRSRRIRGWFGEASIERGQRPISRGAIPAALLARLVRWLLFPVFVASGFLRAGVRRFALVNAANTAVAASMPARTPTFGRGQNARSGMWIAKVSPVMSGAKAG